jgi:hypothetical protein
LSGCSDEPLADVSRRRRDSPVPRILTIVGVRKRGWLALLAPDLFARAPRMFLELRVPFLEVPIDRRSGVIQRCIVAVVNDSARHAAKDGLNYVEKLCASWQWCGIDSRATKINDCGIVLLDPLIQPLRAVPESFDS